MYVKHSDNGESDNYNLKNMFYRIIKYDGIFDKYSLWDQGVRADDRDWLL